MHRPLVVVHHHHVGYHCVGKLQRIARIAPEDTAIPVCGIVARTDRGGEYATIRKARIFLRIERCELVAVEELVAEGVMATVALPTSSESVVKCFTVTWLAFDASSFK